MTAVGGDLMTMNVVELMSVEMQEGLPCRVAAPDLFFAESPADVEQAKALCLDCPVQELCLEGALDRREPWGVWGGQLFVGGAVVARKRPRGRPRKHPVAEPYSPAAQGRSVQSRAAQSPATQGREAQSPAPARADRREAAA